jgi:CheY-like chemotaxis protein
VKFTPEGGAIHLRAFLEGEEDGDCSIRVEVSDTGIGILPEQQSRLFASFMQADNSTSRKYGGTGLGLAISKRIVEMMGGTIWLESEYGKGSTFIFTMKAKRLPDEDEPQSQADSGAPMLDEQAVEHSMTDVFEGARILLAEDVEINGEIVMTLLEPTRVEIDWARNGSEAVRMFTDAPDRYDMIFMDIQMPEMDGYEATRKIRAIGTPRALGIPIVAMTANVFREDVEKCLAAGMNDHVGKPLDLGDVLKKLKHYTQSTQKSRLKLGKAQCDALDVI